MNSIDIEKSKILFWFCRSYPEMVARMRSTLHSYDSRKLNKYHLEDDVWSHTLLVLKSVDVSEINEEWKRETLYLISLLHDCGKVFKRNSHTPGKISFFDHDIAAVHFAIQVLKDKFLNCLENDDFLSDDTIFGNIMYFSLNTIGNHNKCYKANSIEEIRKILNNDINLEKVFRIFSEADKEGRFCYEKDSYLDHFKNTNRICEEQPLNIDDIKHWIYCGVPGSGKDSIAQQAGLNIFSLDKIRLEEYNKIILEDKIRMKESIVSKDQKEFYINAFERTKRLNLLSLLEKKINENKNSLENGFAICNTNTEEKQRKFVLHIIKKIFGDDDIVGCKIVLNTRQFCIENDIMRTSKTVGEDIIDKFLYGMSIPTTAEGFDKIEMIFNYYSILDTKDSRTIKCTSTLF